MDIAVGSTVAFSTRKAWYCHIPQEIYIASSDEYSCVTILLSRPISSSSCIYISIYLYRVCMFISITYSCYNLSGSVMLQLC